MYATVLRLGLWTIILVLIVFVLATAYPDEPIAAELLSTNMLQQALIVGGALILLGLVLRVFHKDPSGAKKNRCRVCRTPIPAGAMYCREHLRAILSEEDEKTHATRVRR